MTKTGAMVRVWGVLYKSIVRSLLLYGENSLVVTWDVLKVLEGFHYHSARRISGMTARRTTSGEWEWPAVDGALETEGVL